MGSKLSYAGRWLEEHSDVTPHTMLDSPSVPCKQPAQQQGLTGLASHGAMAALQPSASCLQDGAWALLRAVSPLVLGTAAHFTISTSIPRTSAYEMHFEADTQGRRECQFPPECLDLPRGTLAHANVATPHRGCHPRTAGAGQDSGRKTQVFCFNTNNKKRTHAFSSVVPPRRRTQKKK